MNLYKKAILKADEIRAQLGLNIFQPVNIFDSCAELGITVRFVDINMEGLYTKHKNGSHPTILLSNQRPLPRRCFTCAHELGHHTFNHGLSIDTLSEQQTTSTHRDIDEQLVDSFAGALLMPLAGVQSEFVKRNWKIQKASPSEFYTICSVFNVGYQTLIMQCKVNGLINEAKANSLIKSRPSKILDSILGFTVKEKSHFKIIDDQLQSSVIDLEVNNYVIFPSSVSIVGEQLKKLTALNTGNTVYKAVSPGITQAISSENGNSHFIRIQKENYVGLAEYRHLENEVD